jgi:hypothetical protein
MTKYTACRKIDVMSGRDCLCSLEARYTFSINADRPSWGPGIDLDEVEIRWNPSQEKWRKADPIAWDMLTDNIPDQWFLDQAAEIDNAHS